MNNNNTETKKRRAKKATDVTLVTEAFKLNKEIEKERVICEELLEKSNNKSGLIKDALLMYYVMVKNHGYVSPYLQTNETDWDRIIAGTVGFANTMGRPTQEVKREYIERHQEPVMEQPVVRFDEVDPTEDNQQDIKWDEDYMAEGDDADMGNDDNDVF